jgi:hypothetical protein
VKIVRKSLVSVIIGASLLGGSGAAIIATSVAAPSGVAAFCPHPTAVEYGCHT